MTDDMKVSEAVVKEVAEREGVSPIDLEMPLYRAIDPEALDALFQNRSDGAQSSDRRFEFSYHGYRVVVTASGTVRVTEQPSASENGDVVAEEFADD